MSKLIGSRFALKLAPGVAIAAVSAFVAVSIPSHLTSGVSFFGASVAKAEEGTGGKGGQGGQSGKGGQGGQGGQGGHSSSQGGESGHGGGKPAGAGQGSGGGGTGGADLGRLNMARAFLSPGFDPAKIDDPEAPLMQIIAYKDAMIAGDKEAAAQALANAATAPISVATVEKLDQLLGIDYNTAVGSIEDFAAYAQSLNKNDEEAE